MKKTKFWCAFLAAALVLSLCACSNGSGNTSSSSGSGVGSGSDSGGGAGGSGGAGSGGGNSGDTPVTYTITIANGITNGTVTANPASATAGSTVTLTITPAVGYSLNSISAATGSNTVTLSGTGNTKTFTMPAGNVTVNASFSIDFSESGCTALPAGTNGTAGTSGIYVEFGYWPQSAKPNTVTIDTTQTSTIAGFNCCKGSDNNWYFQYPQNNNYYKVEPIKWRVLSTNYDHDGNPSTTGKKLLLAENILQAWKYYSYTVDRTVETVTINPNNYEYSEVRAFLNGISYSKKENDSSTQTTSTDFVNNGFLQNAFTTTERDFIVITTVVNNARSTNPDNNASLWESGDNQYASATPTSDKIFLLSEQEVTKEDYGFAAYDQYGTGNTRIRMPTDFAQGSGAMQMSDGGLWWLRSPNCYNGNNAQLVANVGRANDYGSVRLGSVGVVPALCLN